jgi:beta-lactamase class A
LLIQPFRPDHKVFVIKRQLVLVTMVLMLVGFTACSRRDLTSATNLPSREAPPKSCSGPELQAKLNDLSKVTQGPVGVAAMLIETKQEVVLNGDYHYPMQSVYKLPIAMAILDRVDAGTLSLDQKVAVRPGDFVSRREHNIATDYPNGGDLTVRTLLTYMITESDGTACDALIKLFGGPAEVNKYVRELGVQGIEIARYEREMYADPEVTTQNWSTPKAMLEILRLLHEGNVLSESMRNSLLSDMIRSSRGQNRIKAGVPVGVTVAHRPGTSGTYDGITRATNDVGLITLPNGKTLALVVFVSDTKADEKTREGVIADIAKASWNCFWDGTSIPSEKR